MMMESRAFCLLVFYCFISVCDLRSVIHPRNGLRECRKNSTLTALEVLPGGGWDNLRNIDMGRVMNLSYSQCQTTEDGVYLIPDEVFVIPQKESGVEKRSEIIMSWLEQKSSTSSSINADASFLSEINGKFSEENKRMKTHQVKDNSVTARSQVRNHLYTVKAYPDFTLDSRFAQQAVEIADAIVNNQTRQATYLSEKLILDYGTHVITSVDAGATLVQEDYLKKSFVSNSQSDTSSISASAGFSFFKTIKSDIDSKESQESSATQNYDASITYSLAQSHGGALFYPGITLQKWQESTLNNLVAIDRTGLPLHYFLNPSTFPDLPEPTVNKLALSVKEAVQRYYNVNTIPGCVDPDSTNFNFQANMDDASCKGPATNLTFGGIYIICTPFSGYDGIVCNGQSQTNPATGGYSCPEQFFSIQLNSETIERTHPTKWLGVDIVDINFAHIKTFWCYSNMKTHENSGYLFGGLYGQFLQNPITKSRSCPPNFFAQKLLVDGTTVCMSNDYEMGTRFSVPFGGFFSCQSGNPLAQGQSRCPPQFSQHLASISDGCQVLFCVQSGMFTGGELKPVHLPPFTNPPQIRMNTTNTVAVMTDGGNSWVRVRGTKTWRLAKVNEINQIAMMLNRSSDQIGSVFERFSQMSEGGNPGKIDQMASMLDQSSQMSGGQKAGVAVGVMVLIALVVAATVLLVKRRFSGRRVNRGYEEL